MRDSSGPDRAASWRSTRTWCPRTCSASGGGCAPNETSTTSCDSRLGLRVKDPRAGLEAASIEPYWYKDAVFYELRVGAFADSNADGAGDFPGLTQHLDYLHDLGVNTLWLLPFYPSPGKDDGYDIADYRRINSDFGTLRDFKRFMMEAHRRDLRVITELVINHTSDQHPWFKRARRCAPGSDARNWYVWSDNDKKYAGT